MDKIINVHVVIHINPSYFLVDASQMFANEILKMKILDGHLTENLEMRIP